MNLKCAMIKAFEYAIDNDKDSYEDIYVYSKEHDILFSIYDKNLGYDKNFDFEKLKKMYNENSDVSFGVFLIFKKFI